MKNGFTLVEILAVIVLLGIVGTLVGTNILKTFRENKVKIYEENLTLAMQAAKTWGSDNINSLIRIDDEADAISNCTSSMVNIETLINNEYLEQEGNVMINPINNESMNSKTFCVYYLINNNLNSDIIVKLKEN